MCTFSSGQKDIAGYKETGQISAFWNNIMTKQKVVWIFKIIKVSDDIIDFFFFLSYRHEED